MNGDQKKLSEEEVNNSDLLEIQASMTQENESIVEDLVRASNN